MSIRNQGRSTSGCEVGEAVAANGPDRLDLICISEVISILHNVCTSELGKCYVALPSSCGRVFALCLKKKFGADSSREYAC